MDIRGLSQFRHLLVDEFQDINEIQHRLVQHWSESGSFSSSAIRISPSMAFAAPTTNASIVWSKTAPKQKLSLWRENYRPPRKFCKAEVIDENGGKPRSQSDGPSGEAVSVVKCPTPFREAVWLAKEINALCGGGICSPPIAITKM